MLVTTEQTLSLPLIDISPFLAPDDAPDVQLARQATAELVDKACREVGFFYLVGHGLTQEEMTEIRTVAHEFFKQTPEEKEEIHITKNDFARGYQRLGQNITQEAQDWHEAIDLYAPAPKSLLQKGIKTLCGSNPIPRHPERFSTVVNSYVQTMTRLGAAMMRAIGLGLGVGETFFEPYMQEGFWVMRMIGYPPLPSSSTGLSCGEHTDYGCLTLLNADSTPNALQVLSNGKWISPTPLPNAFIINIGDMIQVWTNGIYKSTLHRVIHSSTNVYRISVPFFYEPAFDARVRPIDKCVQESGVERLPDVVYGEHLLGKVTGNFDVGEQRM